VHAILSAIRGIYAILKYHPQIVKDSQQNGDGCLSIIIEALSPKSIHIPAYNQKVRMAAFKCFELLLKNFNEFYRLQDEGNDRMGVDIERKQVNIPYTNIISGVLTAIESEKDPRNLLLSFELTRIVLRLLGNDKEAYQTLKPFSEDIFENIS